MSRTIRRLSILAVAALSVAAVGCSDGSTGPAGATATLRVVNSSSDAVQLRRDGALVGPSVPAGTASAFFAVPAGSAAFEVRVAQAQQGGVSVQKSLDAKGIYALGVGGTGGTLYAAVAEADTGKAVAGRANVRAINLTSPGGPSLDVYVTAPGGFHAGAVWTWQMDAGVAQYSGLRDFAPGDLLVTVALRGTMQSLGSTVIPAVPADGIRIITLHYTGNNVIDIAVADGSP